MTRDEKPQQGRRREKSGGFGGDHGFDLILGEFDDEQSGDGRLKRGGQCNEQHGDGFDLRSPDHELHDAHEGDGQQRVGAEPDAQVALG